MDDTHHSTGASQNAGEKQPTFESAKVNEPQEFPDGGLRAWLVVLGAFFGLLISFGWTNCMNQSKSPGEREKINPSSHRCRRVSSLL